MSRLPGLLAATLLGTATAQTAPHPPSTMHHPAHATTPADRPPAPPQVQWSTNRASRRARERMKA